MQSRSVIRVRGLRKAYGAKEAVRGIDLDAHAGEVVALLGPNGAGKTTTVEILEGYRARTAGEVDVLGHDPGRGEATWKARIGIVLQASGIEPYLTAEEVLDAYGGTYPTPRPAGDVLQQVGLADAAGTRVGRLSGGQRRRLDLALALVGRPELVFLDEPTTGFDPSARRDAWGTIRSLAADGTTVLLTTHFMDEAQALADRLVVLVDGAIAAQGTTAEVIGRTSQDAIIRFRRPSAHSLPADLPVDPDPTDPERLHLRTPDPTRSLHGLTAWALAQGSVLEDLTVSRPSLEDTYLELTGRPPEAAQTADQRPPTRRGRRR